jgi:hypothetical protein
MRPSFFTDGGGLAILINGVASEVEFFLIRTANLRFKGMTDDADSAQREMDVGFGAQFQRKRMREAGECGRTGKTPSEGTGDRVRILDAEARKKK